MGEAAFIDGVGAVTGHGAGAGRFFQALLEGKTAIRPVTRFSTEGLCSQVAAEAPLETPPSGPSRCAALLLAAADEALKNRPRPPPERRGVVVGTTKGAFEAELQAWNAGRAGPENATEEPLRALAERTGARGPAFTVGAACASSLVALGRGLRLIQDGRCDEVVVGGAEALHAFVYAGFHALKALSPRPAQPFDAGRSGLSLGEGAAVLVLVSPAFARAERLQPKVRLAGFGLSGDAHDQTAPDPTGDGLARACRQALVDAGRAPRAVSAYFAHGTATPHNDRMEAAAYRALFEGRAVPLCAAKGSVGHTLGASGTLDAIAACLALESGTLPPVTNFARLDPALEVAPVQGAPTRLSGATALVASAGFGGVNAALVLERETR